MRGHNTLYGGFSDEGYPVDIVFEETGKPVTKEDHKQLSCAYCGRLPTSQGHDACIANLPSVEYACCGHHTNEGYLNFTNGIIIRGYFDTSNETESTPKKEFDNVLSGLSGVKEAYLGDNDHEGYIKFTNGIVITGYFTIERK
ncbi:hypothetical protein [Methanobacterium sp. MBAC-LM]|uniref:hypothetical protein n=1 Tax=Methanobacterium sp. MBAC-LM TaxID=3412034 RepID=UPI003C795FC5